MAGEFGVLPLSVKVVTERAVGPEACPGVVATGRIHVQGVRKLEDDRPLILVSRKSEQIAVAGGRKAGVARSADLGVGLAPEGGRVAGDAGLMVVSWALEDNGTLFFRKVANDAIEPEFLGMDGVH